jgi:NitT/TauT family transport system permease protein
MERAKFAGLIQEPKPQSVPARRYARSLADRLPAMVTFLALAVSWELAVRLSRTPAYLVPLPSAIVLRTVEDLPYFLGEATVTVVEALGGLLLASVGALAAALLMARARWLERALFPLAVAVKVTPMVAVAPLLVLWLGFGPAPKIIVAALLSYFPILSNAMTGFRSVNPDALAFLRSLDASSREILLELRVPHALPYLFSAYKVATTLSVIGAVVAEWVGADRGLGHVIILANSNLDMTTLGAAVLVLAVIGIGLYLLVDALERRCLFWHESVLTTEVYR